MFDNVVLSRLSTASRRLIRTRRWQKNNERARLWHVGALGACEHTTRTAQYADGWSYMLEVALFTLKDKALIINGVLLVVLVMLLVISAWQQALRPLYWIGVVLFFTAGVAGMIAGLLRQGMALDAALWVMLTNLGFVAVCGLLVQGPSRLFRIVDGENAAPAGARILLKKWLKQEAWCNAIKAGATSEASSCDQQPQLAEKLTRFMEQQKPYLEPHITVDRLAIKLNVSPKLLSGTINNELHVNFFELISQYRLEEAKKRLADTALREIPICEIMKRCGFNSKSIFNQAFKKSVGVTPSHYRQQHLHSMV